MADQKQQKPFAVSIVWGEHPEPGQRATTREFATQEELDIYLEGVEDGIGWGGFQVVPSPEYVVPAHDEDEG